MMTIVFALFGLVIICIALALLGRIFDKMAPKMGPEVADWAGIIKGIVCLGILILIFYWLFSGGYQVFGVR